MAASPLTDPVVSRGHSSSNNNEKWKWLKGQDYNVKTKQCLGQGVFVYHNTALATVMLASAHNFLFCIQFDDRHSRIQNVLHPSQNSLPLEYWGGQSTENCGENRKTRRKTSTFEK